MTRFFSFLFLMTAIFSVSYGQVSSDALLFSQRLQPNSARSAAVGGALGALGGDMATLNVNPAGLAIYRSNEFILSPGLQFGTVRSTFVSDSTMPTSRTARSGLNFGNIGLIISTEMQGDWRHVNFGVSYSRVASFARSFNFSGTSYGSRIVNFVEEANASGAQPDGLDPFEEQLAWDAYLIDGFGSYVGALTDSNYVSKSQTVRQSGGINELSLAFGGNYLHKFYISGALGINFLRFRDVRSYSEEATTNNIDFKSMTFTEDRNMRGTGVNFKLGMIYRATKSLRVGLAVHTPTAFGLTEELNTSLAGSVVYNDTLRVRTIEDPLLSPTGQYRSNFFSPWLFHVSLGNTFGKKDSKLKGFLGIDAEYLNYSSGLFALKVSDVNATSGDIAYINNVNDAVLLNYRGVGRFRVGGELAMEALRLRAGYRLETSPYTTPVKGVTDMRHDISAGIGIRTEHVFFDFTYVHTMEDFAYSPYYATSTLNNQRTINDRTNGLVLLTIGFRF